MTTMHCTCDMGHMPSSSTSWAAGGIGTGSIPWKEYGIAEYVTPDIHLGSGYLTYMSA